MSVTKYQNLLEEEEETFDTAESMDPELYRATIKGDILEFFRAMHRESLDHHNYPPAPCVQLGPQKNTVQKDKQGCYPIHSACTKGFLDIVKLLLQHRPDMTELLNAHDQNILHIAAKSGRCNVVKYLLRLAEMEKLVNAKDEEGNTPLHLATSSGYPNMAVLLAKHEKTILRLANNHRHTALDIADEYMEKGSASFQKQLTWMALRLFRVPRARQAKSFRSTSFKIGDQQETESWRDKINIILLVATFIATVTFQAGLTVPGGYNNTNPDQGIATLLEKVQFQEFVICNAIAMYSSIIVAVTLLWAQQGGPGSMHIALKLALPLLGIALIMMSLAFTAGVYLVVSKLNWLAKAILMMGSTFITVLFVLFVPLCFLGSSNNDIFRRVSHYPFYLVVYALGR